MIGVYDCDEINEGDGAKVRRIIGNYTN